MMGFRIGNPLTTAPSPAPVDYSRKWYVMIAVVAGILLATVDGSIVNVALPTLVDSLETTFNRVQWVSIAYLVAAVTLTLGAGRLGDIFGKRTLYSTGFAVFTVASVLCGLAPTVGWLIAGRVLQAVGSAMILALGAAIVVEAFPANERGKALGYVGSAVSVGIVSGPIIGGLIISTFGWRPIFLVNLPIGIIGTWLALKYTPRSQPAPGQKLDIWGSTLLCLTLLCFALALTLGQEAGFTSPEILGLFAVSVLAGVAFAMVQLRVESPMLDLRMFRSSMLTVSVVSGFLFFVCLASTFLLMPFFLQGVLGHPIGFVGVLLGATPLMMGIISPFSGTLSDRVGIRRLTVLGLAIVMISFSVLLTFTTETTVARYLLHAIPLGIGLGLFQSPNNSAIMGSVPPEYMGIGGGLLTMNRLLGVTTGVALLGSLWAASVASASGGVLPEGGASAASPTAQVAGLHTTYRVALVILAVSLAVNIWGLRKERRDRRLKTADLAAEA